MSRIEALTERIGDVPITTRDNVVRGKSRDSYWYSPVLKEKLKGVMAEAVVSPRSEEELLRVLAACWALDIPVTPRGGGTGNYAQAVPLAGGVVLDMKPMNRIRSDRRRHCRRRTRGRAEQDRGGDARTQWTGVAHASVDP